MAEVRWLERASRQVAEIYAFLAQQSGDAAGTLVADIFAAVDRLGDFPESGAAFEGLVGYRHWTVRRHRVIYRVEGDLVLIGAVVDGRRHFGPSSIA